MYSRIFRGETDKKFFIIADNDPGCVSYGRYRRGEAVLDFFSDLIAGLSLRASSTYGVM